MMWNWKENMKITKIISNLSVLVQGQSVENHVFGVFDMFL